MGGKLILRVVITQVDEGFIVSVCVVHDKEAPAIIGEDKVPTLAAAHDFIEQLNRKLVNRRTPPTSSSMSLTRQIRVPSPALLVADHAWIVARVVKFRRPVECFLDLHLHPTRRRPRRELGRHRNPRRHRQAASPQ